MRRRAARPLGLALDRVARATRPAGVLAAVQAVWADVAGAAIAAEAEPVSERGGVVTVACGSAAWAQELQLLAGELAAKLDERTGGGRVRELRFVTRARGSG